MEMHQGHSISHHRTPFFACRLYCVVHLALCCTSKTGPGQRRITPQIFSKSTICIKAQIVLANLHTEHRFSSSPHFSVQAFCSEEALTALLCSQFLKVCAAGSKVSTPPCPPVTGVVQTIVSPLLNGRIHIFLTNAQTGYFPSYLSQSSPSSFFFNSVNIFSLMSHNFFLCLY